MSTRSIIARAKGDGWEGRYHHFDGFPSGVGAGLFDHFRRSFDRDLTRMLEVLIDEHPAGWSTINGADFTQPIGFIEWSVSRQGMDDETYFSRAQCYCHGDRSEGEDLRTHDQPHGFREEYLYVLFTNPATDRNFMHVFDTHYGQDILLASVDLDDEEPDWGTMEVPDDSDHPAVVAWRAEMSKKYPGIYS